MWRLRREAGVMGTVRKSRVVVGVDDSLAGLEALRFAVAEARRRGATLRAIRAWRAGPSWSGTDAGPTRAELADQAALTIVAAFLQAMGGKPRGVAVEAFAVEGSTVQVLVTQAEGDDDVLVVGRSRRRRFRPSGVDVQCVRTAPCPVIAVAAPALARTRGSSGLRRDVVSAAEAFVREAVTSPPER
jgi:nucleotide-binding universal stress UspA family protein